MPGHSRHSRGPRAGRTSTRVMGSSGGSTMKRSKLSRRQCLGSLLAGCAFPAWARAAKAPTGRDVPWLSEVQTPPGRLPDDAPQCQVQVPRLVVGGDADGGFHSLNLANQIDVFGTTPLSETRFDANSSLTARATPACTLSGCCS